MEPEVAVDAAAAGITAVGVVVAGVSAFAALQTYDRDVKHKQTHWLYELFEDFYKNDIYIAIRQTLTMGSSNANGVKITLSDARIALLTNPTPEEYIDLADDICDYLNFFEFVCNLVHAKRMDRPDVDRLFDYYLDNLAEQDFIIEYLAQDGNSFEALRAELWAYHGDHIPAGLGDLRPARPVHPMLKALREINDTRPLLPLQHSRV
jgi:hypothetical protein